MTTIPRHCLVSFADYKQKDLAVNGKINFQTQCTMKRFSAYGKHLSGIPPCLVLLIAIGII